MKCSVIIPVYNASKTLHRCVDSILAQSFTDFELLLINDGSKDDSGVICDEYAAKDSRVRVFHKENGGVSSARNVGLDNAKGEWIAFIDVDDWVELDYLASLLRYQDADIVLSTCVEHYQDGGVHKTIKENDFQETFKGIGKVLSECLHITGICAPWCKVFKRNLIELHNIRFSEAISYGEDWMFNLQYLQHIQSIGVSGQPFYHYYFSDTGLTGRSLSFEEIDTPLAYICTSFKIIEERYHFISAEREMINVMDILSKYHISSIGYIQLYKDIKALSARDYLNIILRKNKLGLLGRFVKMCFLFRMHILLSITYFVTKRFPF